MFIKSHPVWVCGLKLLLSKIILLMVMSHPVWVCGLKLRSWKLIYCRLSHTLYGCVD